MDNPKEIRRKILQLAIDIGSWHIASSLSTVEILLSVYDIKDIEDKFILSKGHGCLGLYIILQSRGLHPKLLIHPEIDPINGIECTAGSLGHGLPMAVGVALAKKIKKEKGVVYVLVGDGECQEGTTWESISIANYYGLDNLIVIVDNNGLQGLDFTCNIDKLDLYDKFLSFGCELKEVDGHNMVELVDSLLNVERFAPYVIIADTTKGKGISFMENKPEYHARQLSKDEIKQAYKDLS